MRPHAALVLILAAIVAFGGPLLLGLAGLRGREAARAEASRQPPLSRLILASAITYAVAFDLVFFLQELFLVLPKAVTPGLHPVLFHNNHDWTGSNPLAELEQGTGALVILLVGLAATTMLPRIRRWSTTARLFVFWIAYHGLFSSLPQLVAGAAIKAQDVGRAMTYLHFPLPLIWTVAALALAAMAFAGTQLARPLLELAPDPALIAGRGGRSLFALKAAALPAVLGTLLILPCRMPGSIDQVAIVPIAVALFGIPWIQASAWRVTDAAPPPGARPPSIALPLAAFAVVLLVFQLVLRPGVAF